MVSDNYKPILVGLLCFAMTGCSRPYWRNQADTKAYPAIGERFVDPRWTLPRVDLTPDPLSRFYDPYDQDCAPLPPDDDAAHEYMHCVYGMRGYKHWHSFGDTGTVENPDWLDPYGGSPDVVNANYSRPAVLPEIKKLTLEEAVGLSYRHSREFQTELENVYLTALDLTFQRFRFDTQFFGVSGQRPGADLVYDVGEDRSNVSVNSNAGINKLLPTGGELAAELANNTLWLFSGPNTSNTQSVLSFSIVQPLLRNGGRRFALESLTQAERDLLYAVRDFSRFRMGFFTNVVAGTRSSGGVSGVGGSFAGGSGGYLGLLQTYQRIQNQRFNIRLQEQQLETLRAQAARPPEMAMPLAELPMGALIPPALAGKLRYDDVRKLLILRGQLTRAELEQARAVSDNIAYLRALDDLDQLSSTTTTSQSIAQVETQLYTSRINLATQLRGLQDALDSYKLGIGIPTDTTVTLDTSMIKPFELIDSRLVAVQDALRFFVRDIWAIPDDEVDQAQLAAVADTLKELVQVLRRDGIDVLTAELAQVTDLVAKRGSKVESTDVPPYDPSRDANLLGDRKDELLEYEALLSDARGKLRKPNLAQAEKVRLRDALLDLQSQFFVVAQGLAQIQVDIRLELIPLNHFQMPLDEATAIALENRVDLMNVRALVMDARRKVEVAANQLQAILDLRAEGDVRTPTIGQGNDNPVDFRQAASDYRLGVSFTSPIQLVQERNNYRAALIDYQRARRQYMRAEDLVKQDVRNAWRQLVVLRQNFERAKHTTRLAALQYDITAENSNDPRARGFGGAGAQGGGGGSQNQAQGLQLLQAFGTILNAQNTLIQTWVDYETNRLNIYRDMGTMVIDEKGFWIDSYYQDRLAKAGCVDLPELRPVDPPVLAAVPTGISDPTSPVGSEPASPSGVESSSASPNGVIAPPQPAPPAPPQELPNGPAAPPERGPNLPADQPAPKQPGARAHPKPSSPVAFSPPWSKRPAARQ